MSEFDRNGQQENLMQRFMSDHRELFWSCVKNYDSPFFFVCIVICLLRYYVYFFLCKLELLWAWPSYTRIPTNQISYSYSYPYAYETPTLCSCRLLYWSHADSRIFPFVSASHRCVKSSIARSCRASYRVYRSRCLGSQSALVCFSLRNW